MCVFLHVPIALVAGLPRRFQLHDKTNRIVSEPDVRRNTGAGYVQLGPVECNEPEDGKKRTNAGKAAEKLKKTSAKDDDACSKLKRCRLS